MPASSFTIEDAEAILRDNGIDPNEAQIQERSSDSGDLIKIQVADQPADVREQLRTEFAEAADVSGNEISVNSVSSTWGREITEKAVRALVIFLSSSRCSSRSGSSGGWRSHRSSPWSTTW